MQQVENKDREVMGERERFQLPIGAEVSRVSDGSYRLTC
jgi:hypothetical protein